MIVIVLALFVFALIAVFWVDILLMFRCAQMYKTEGARARSEKCGWVAVNGGGKREGTLGSEKQQAACSQSSADPRSCPKPR